MALVGLLTGPVTRAAGDDPQPVDPTVAREVQDAIRALDDEDFAARAQAAQQLSKRIEEPGLAAFLAGQFARVLLSSDSSFEVRTQIDALGRRLPAAAVAAGDARPKATEIGPLLDDLNSDSSLRRDSAQRRLTSMLQQTELIAPVYFEFKCRAAEPALNTQGRRTLEPLLDRAREAWLAADPASVPLPAVSAEEIRRLIGDLTSLDAAPPADRFRRDLAEHELLDLVARDDTRSLVLKVLGEKIAQAPDAAASTTLQTIADFARPAMAAEVWMNRVNTFIQYLAVGVPQHNEGAPNPTHFDRIDETTAHCVTGASLNEGDYPVRIAIPHPEPGYERMFYLTNLPTARRRLLYEYQVRRHEVVRLREISQRTLDSFLNEKRVLDETRLMLLSQLDQRVVSSFAARYFTAVPNAPLKSSFPELREQLTVHSGLCYMLTLLGTHEAAPALEQLARSGRLGKPVFESPYQMAWIAALAIAQRDPWPEIDSWLAGLIDQTTPLAANIDPPPQVGATAAALLLDRHGASTRPFGLDASEIILGPCRFVGYRYGSEKDREDVARWWQKNKQATVDAAGP